MIRYSQILKDLNRNHTDMQRYIKYLERLSDLKDKGRISEKTYRILKAEYESKSVTPNNSPKLHEATDQTEHDEIFVVEDEKEVEDGDVTIEVE